MPAGRLPSSPPGRGAALELLHANTPKASEKVRFYRTKRSHTAFSFLTAWLQPNYDFRVFIIRQREERERRRGAEACFWSFAQLFPHCIHVSYCTQLGLAHAGNWTEYQKECESSSKTRSCPTSTAPGCLKILKFLNQLGIKLEVDDDSALLPLRSDCTIFEAICHFRVRCFFFHSCWW